MRLLLFPTLVYIYIFRCRQFGILRRLTIDPFALTLLCTTICGGPCLAQSKEASTAAQNKAKALYQELCQRCHAANGKGEPSAKGVPDFTNRAWQEQRSDVQMVVSILEGKGTEMVGFRSQLNRAKAKDLVAYVRAFTPARPSTLEKKPATGAAPSQDFDEYMKHLQKELQETERQQKELVALPRNRASPPKPEKEPSIPAPREGPGPSAPEGGLRPSATKEDSGPNGRDLSPKRPSRKWALRRLGLRCTLWA
jgi:mono/diheme cytochrome c family protein